MLKNELKYGNRLTDIGHVNPAINDSETERAVRVSPETALAFDHEDEEEHVHNF